MAPAKVSFSSLEWEAWCRLWDKDGRDRSLVALSIAGTESKRDRLVSIRDRSDHAPTGLRDTALRCDGC